MKFFLSVNGKTSQKAPKATLAVCSMLITFLQEVMRVIPGFNACRLAPKLLLNLPGTKYIRRQKCHTQSSMNIHKNIFSLCGSILPARVANHSAGFGSSCPLTEQTIFNQ